MVGVTRVRRGAFGQQPARIRRRVQDRYPGSTGHVEQSRGTLVQQGVPVVRDHRLEAAGLDVTDQHIDGSACDADVLDHALLLEAEERFHRPARRHHGFERLDRVFRIVQKHQLESVQAEQTQAALDRAAGLVAAEVARRQVAVGFGAYHESRRSAAQLAQHQANAPLALTVAVRGGRIQEVEGALEHAPQDRPRLLLGHTVAERVRHVRERSAADADRGHVQPRATEWPRSKFGGGGRSRHVGHSLVNQRISSGYRPVATATYDTRSGRSAPHRPA